MLHINYFSRGIDIDSHFSVISNIFFFSSAHCFDSLLIITLFYIIHADNSMKDTQKYQFEPCYLQVVARKTKGWFENRAQLYSHDCRGWNVDDKETLNKIYSSCLSWLNVCLTRLKKLVDVMTLDFDANNHDLLPYSDGNLISASIENIKPYTGMRYSFPVTESFVRKQTILIDA